MAEDFKGKHKHLGRGLESLLGPLVNLPVESSGQAEPALETHIFPVDKELRHSIKDIALESIRPNPYQPRTTWNQEELNELANSIRANGIIQPILVRPVGETYEVIAGERRLKAAGLAGLKTIPAMVRDATDVEMLELALVENIHRADLNPLERAQAYQNFLSTFSLSQTEAAGKLGEDRSVLSNYLRLLDLPQEIKQMLTDGSLSMGHARAILALPTDELRRKLANRAFTSRLSVREVEHLVRLQLDGPSRDKVLPKEKPAHIADLENQLRAALGTKVKIDTRKKGGRGRIIIEFSSLDEFDRLTEKMGIAHTDNM